MFEGWHFIDRADGTETEKAREVKLLVMPDGLARRFVREKHKPLDGEW